MDYSRFIEHLPALYENWGGEQVQPKSDQFQQVLTQVQGMTTANVMQLLNFAVRCMEPEEVYCEVGCFQGATLIGAMLEQPGRLAYAVDNFSEFDADGTGIDRLIANLSAFDLTEQVFFSDQNFEEFFFNLRQLETEDKIGVYLYDGAHDYRSQLLGLLLAKPFLAEKAVIIVDDSNWSSVQQANWDFIAAHPQCELLLDLPTSRSGDSTFWNGIQILSWDTKKASQYDWQTIRNNHNSLLINAIYQLSSEFELQKARAARS